MSCSDACASRLAMRSSVTNTTRRAPTVCSSHAAACASPVSKLEPLRGTSDRSAASTGATACAAVVHAGNRACAVRANETTCTRELGAFARYDATSARCASRSASDNDREASTISTVARSRGTLANIEATSISKRTTAWSPRFTRSAEIEIRSPAIGLAKPSRCPPSSLVVAHVPALSRWRSRRAAAYQLGGTIA